MSPRLAQYGTAEKHARLPSFLKTLTFLLWPRGCLDTALSCHGIIAESPNCKSARLEQRVAGQFHLLCVLRTAVGWILWHSSRRCRFPDAGSSFKARARITHVTLTRHQRVWSKTRLCGTDCSGLSGIMQSGSSAAWLPARAQPLSPWPPRLPAGQLFPGVTRGQRCHRSCSPSAGFNPRSGSIMAFAAS